MSLARLKKKHSFCVTLSVVTLVFSLISRADQSSNLIQKLVSSHELREHSTEPLDNNTMSMHTHQHTHSDGTTHTHAHHTHCSHLSSDTIGTLTLIDTLAPLGAVVEHRQSFKMHNVVLTYYFSDILRPPILA